jgi:aldose 1-epimerase
MSSALHILKNDHWQAGILPGTGASIAFGRVRKNGEWIDVLRPTAEADYSNSSNCSSFIMLPWCNRIKDGLLRFDGHEYHLRTAKDDGTARHGDVRGRAWQIDKADESHIRMSIHSDDHPDMNWPFKFSATAVYALDGDLFNWTLSLTNEDTRLMPTGFGHHPYFVRPVGAQPQVQIACKGYYPLKNFMAESYPMPIKSDIDFRQMRALDDQELNDLLTRSINQETDPRARIVYPDADINLAMFTEAVFEHILIFAPKGKPFFAVEPMTNASDGFNILARGFPDSGVFVLQPGQEKSGVVKLQLNTDE